jgi:hypothetical protein
MALEVVVGGDLPPASGGALLGADVTVFEKSNTWSFGLYRPLRLDPTSSH